MAHSHSHSNPYSDTEQRALLDLARRSIHTGVLHGVPETPEIDHYPQNLRETAAAFVTLTHGGVLRGCTGTLTAEEPLVITVAENAFRAALYDPRFPPVNRTELHALEIHISVLSTPEPFTVTDEAELLGSLVPGRDGLVLGIGHRRATFLPSVWEQLPEPSQFVRQLKLKAGLPAEFWSPEIAVERYRAHSVGEAAL